MTTHRVTSRVSRHLAQSADRARLHSGYTTLHGLLGFPSRGGHVRHPSCDPPVPSPPLLSYPRRLARVTGGLSSSSLTTTTPRATVYVCDRRLTRQHVSILTIISLTFQNLLLESPQGGVRRAPPSTLNTPLPTIHLKDLRQSSRKAVTYVLYSRFAVYIVCQSRKITPQNKFCLYFPIFNKLVTSIKWTCQKTSIEF